MVLTFVGKNVSGQQKKKNQGERKLVREKDLGKPYRGGERLKLKGF